MKQTLGIHLTLSYSIQYHKQPTFLINKIMACANKRMFGIHILYFCSNPIVVRKKCNTVYKMLLIKIQLKPLKSKLLLSVTKDKDSWDKCLQNDVSDESSTSYAKGSHIGWRLFGSAFSSVFPNLCRLSQRTF